jgi:Tfp pilus assembly protein PilO
MMSKRERSILVAAGVVVALAGVDYFFLSPLLASRDRLAEQETALQARVRKVRDTRAASVRANRRWNDFRAAGLATDASATESNLLNGLRTWSQEAGLPLQSIRPDRATDAHGMHELTFQVTANGPMRAVAAFLYRVETAELPVRVRELQIASRSEGVDDLSVVLRVSTLWEDREAPAAVTKGQP